MHRALLLHPLRRPARLQPLGVNHPRARPLARGVHLLLLQRRARSSRFLLAVSLSLQYQISTTNPTLQRPHLTQPPARHLYSPAVMPSALRQFQAPHPPLRHQALHQPLPVVRPSNPGEDGQAQLVLGTTSRGRPIAGRSTILDTGPMWLAHRYSKEGDVHDISSITKCTKAGGTKPLSILQIRQSSSCKVLCAAYVRMSDVSRTFYGNIHVCACFK